MNRTSTTALIHRAAWQSRIPRQRAATLCEHYAGTLFEDVIPWWMRHAVDRKHGGIFSCLERDGHTYSGDKFTWMQGRFVWMFSHLYNRHSAKAEWLEPARHGADYLQRHAFQPDGKMYFRLTREGQPLAKCLSLYSEAFTMLGFAELAHATTDAQLWQQAVDMYQRILPRLGVASDTPLLGYPLMVPVHLHAHDMVRITLAWVLYELKPQEAWREDLQRSAESIVSRHWKPELGVLLENVGMDGEPLLELCEGRMVHPGHAIESAWMLMEIALGGSGPMGGSPAGNGAAVHPPVNDALMQTAIDIVLKSLEQGWDRKYGGIRYVLSLDGSPSHVLEADLKLWWPHCETLYALLLAWAYTGREDIGQWYDKVHDYAFSRFSDREHGEWLGYLNRDGSPVFTAKATAWKCCFHLPRALFRCYQLLERQTRPQTSAIPEPHTARVHQPH